jgi:hydroxylamine dehydrogenase
MRRGFKILVLLSFTAAMLLGARPADDTIEGKCMTCHKEKTKGLYQQWYHSEHGKHNVTCYDCHKAEKSDADAFMHEGALIATLVTPQDCASCHPNEAKQTMDSHHATAGQILQSNDAYLAHVIGGHPAAITGCESCHGAKVEIDPASPNKLSKASWPNSGIGRINPDGSWGSCNACHTRHSFSKAQARQPETCGKCHLGPDHPQKEIYEESKHGIMYYTNVDKMNLKADVWRVGVDYFEAPTCATCHMSASAQMAVTHDVGDRISWTLRPAISKKLDKWENRRDNMKQVCSSCHEDQFINGHYYQYDALVMLYNEKFAKPATDIMNLIKKADVMEHKAEFANDIEWVYWEIWHHEGRRARHGAAMMGPDYTWWHGIYEVGKHFYLKFIPEALEYDVQEVNAYIEKMLKENKMHNWMDKPAADLKQGIKDGSLQVNYKALFEQ